MPKLIPTRGLQTFTRLCFGTAGLLWVSLAVILTYIASATWGRPGSVDYGDNLADAESVVFASLAPASLAVSGLAFILMVLLVGLHCVNARRLGERVAHPLRAALYLLVPVLNPFLAEGVLRCLHGIGGNKRSRWIGALHFFWLSAVGGLGLVVGVASQVPDGDTVADTRIVALVLAALFSLWAVAMFALESSMGRLPVRGPQTVAPVRGILGVMAVCILSGAVVFTIEQRSAVGPINRAAELLAFSAKIDWSPSNDEVICLDAAMNRADFSAAQLQENPDTFGYSDEILRSLARAALVCDRPGGIRDDLLTGAVLALGQNAHVTGYRSCLEDYFVGPVWEDLYVEVSQLELFSALDSYSRCIELSERSIGELMGSAREVAKNGRVAPEITESEKLVLIAYPNLDATVVASPSWARGTMLIGVGFRYDSALSVETVKPVLRAALLQFLDPATADQIEDSAFGPFNREAEVAHLRLCSWMIEGDKVGVIVQPRSLPCEAVPGWR